MEREMGSEVRKIYAGADCMVTSLGNSTDENFREALAYRSGCRKVDSPVPGIGGLPLGLIDRSFKGGGDGNPQEGDGCTFLENLFISTIGDVIKRSGVTLDREDTLLILSSTKGNIEYLSAGGEVDERVHLGKMAERIGGYFNARNTPLVISNACISGLSAVTVASRLILDGRYSNVIVAGGDTVTEFVVSGFESFRSLSRNVCRPYDAARDGLTLGEGCGALLLTSDITIAGDDPIEVAGCSVSNDANHISGPSRTGEGLHMAIAEALAESGLTCGDVDFINGHGTATVFNDEMESKAYSLAGLEATPLNSFKPYFGHTLGAAGIIELIMCLQQLRNGVVLGVPGFKECGTPLPVNVSAEHRHLPLSVCLKTASGFGGCNAAVVLARAGKANRKQQRPKGKATVTANAGLEYSGEDFAGFIKERYRQTGETGIKFYKMDNLSKAGYISAFDLLDSVNLQEKYKRGRTGIILENHSSSLDSDIRHRQVMESAPAEGCSPAVFVYTLPNIVAGEICIRHKIRGDNTFFITSPGTLGFAGDYARLLVENGYLDAAVCGFCEYTDGCATVWLELIENLNIQE